MKGLTLAPHGGDVAGGHQIQMRAAAVLGDGDLVI
jgi:hypothetical protein